MKKLQGFTIVEVLVVVAILVILSGITLTSFYSFQSRRTLELTTKEVRQIFEEARSRTVAAVNDSAHGVFLSETKVTLFEGESFVEGDVNNYEFELHPRVRISAISFSPSTDTIVFKKGVGEVNAEGFVEISLVNNSEEKRQIFVSKQGIISSNE